jgi:hypothetical protein
MKAQTIIVQFIIFFILSIIILSAVGYFFRLQSDILRGDIISSYRNLVNSYISAASTSLLDSCKMCDYGRIYFKLPNTTAGYYTEISFVNNQSTVISQPDAVSSASSLHNLNYTLIFEGFSHSMKLIALTLEKDKNILEVS